MAQTLAEIRQALNDIIGDEFNDRFSEATKNRAINFVLQGLISSRTLSFVKINDIQVRDGEYEYTFPEDMLEPLAFIMDDIEGQVIASSSWKSLTGNLDVSELRPLSNNNFFNQAYNYANRTVLRDIVSENKFIFAPKYDASLEGSLVTQDDFPSSADLDSYWTDSYNGEDYVYKCTEGYSAAAEYATLTIPATALASGVALTITATTPGITHFSVVINRVGASGTSALVQSGAGTRASPYKKTLNLYDNDSSNNAIIALLAGSGVAATGASATEATVLPIAETELVNDAEGRWEAQVIHLRYAALFPKLTADTDELPGEMPVLLRESDGIAILSAVKLLKNLPQDDSTTVKIRMLQAEGDEILDRVKLHRMGTLLPDDLTPG